MKTPTLSDAKPGSSVDPTTMPAPRPSYWELIRFFVPLALQAACQSLTYPLVAAVASRGEGGAVNLAGLAQSNSVMFLLGTLGAGMIAAGMVFGTTRQGLAVFKRANLLIGLAVVSMQAILCTPFIAHYLFAHLMGLPPAIEGPARITLLSTIPLNILFCLRNPFQVVLYNSKETGKAGFATLSRVMLTALLSPLFCWAGLIGPQWAVVCLTLPVAWETAASWYLSLPARRRLAPSNDCPPAIVDILKFNAPLSMGGLFLTLSGMLMGAFIARAPDPERVLPAYYIAIGLANPMAFAASRLQNVVLAFCRHNAIDPRFLRFSLIGGLILSGIPLLFLLPGLATLYYGMVQNVVSGDMPLIRATALALAGFPLSVALRSHQEGIAAFRKQTLTIMGGHFVYLAALSLTGLVCLFVGLPGTLLGPFGLMAANLCAAAVLSASLNIGGLRRDSTARLATEEP